MVTITMNNNNIFELSGDRKGMRVLIKLHEDLKVKHPQAFFLRRSGSVPRGWDGHIHYVTENLTFKSGLMAKVYQSLIDYGQKIKIIDNRNKFDINPKIPKDIMGKELRGYQLQAIKNLVFNKIGKSYFPIGVQKAATNAGKTIIMAGIYYAYKRKIPTIVLLKDGDLFEQFKKELPELIPKNELGFVRGKEINFNNFTVAMVQTLSPKVSYYKNQLSKFGIVLVDEADEGESKSYKNIIKNLFNTFVRCGLSGSIYLNNRKKDEMKNMNLRSFFGDVVFEIDNKEMVEKGYSTKPVMKIWPGNQKPGIKGDYDLEYKKCITKNKKRVKAGVKRLEFNIKHKRLPALIIFKYHKHGELIYKIFNKYFGDKYKIGFVHGDIKNRKDIITKFRDGKLDILISSFIVKRGKNFPLIKYIQNLAGSDSHSTILQILGRGLRKHESKNKFYIDDFFDEGHYLKRHSKHRVNYYKKEGFRVYEKYK